MFELDEPLAFLPATILALAIGLLIGAEREWSQYSRQSERLMAGIRTFGLLGLVGSLSVVFSELLHPWAWAFVSTGVMLLIIAGYIAEVRATGDWGMTTEVAMLVTYLLGSLATLDHMVLAAALGVVVAALLSLKAVLHTQVHRLEKKKSVARSNSCLSRWSFCRCCPMNQWGRWIFLTHRLFGGWWC